MIDVNKPHSLTNDNGSGKSKWLSKYICKMYLRIKCNSYELVDEMPLLARKASWHQLEITW